MAPLAATLAASVTLGVGLVLARAERERRRKRERTLDRRLALRPLEPLGEGLRRMALAQTDLAIELLQTGDSHAPDEAAVHETRKAIKRLRALLRLLRHELGERTYARENDTLREVAAHLSGARDAAVMLGTLDALMQREPRKLARRGGVLALRQRLLAEHARQQSLTFGDDGTRAQVLGELHAFRYRVAAWSLPAGEGIGLVDADLARIYTHGRDRHRRAERAKGERTLAMHMWRKRVKDLRYATEMLDRRNGDVSASKSSDPRLRKIAGRADGLGELLGEEHDLAVFTERLRAGARGKRRTSSPQGKDPWRTGRRTRAALLKAVAKRRRKLRGRALRDGERLYGEKPKRFMRRVRSAYDAGARARP